ncbi:MAG: amidase [Acidobacteria bacterium]|nr:amidase [Acidobacteriota bacterium]
MNELVFLSMKRMAEMIRRKEISSAELMDAHLARIAKVNPEINAVVEMEAEEARNAARNADARLARGEAGGPLDGVPMSVKGAWDCAGWINTGGTLGRKGLVAPQDATVIARMKRAGAIPIGVTNLPEFSLAFESDNLVYGRTNNPYDVTRTPGGSGGGGSAAIASGCSPFEVGGDLGGSIRVPAHFAGIAGLKTTLGRVPLSGYFPGPFGMVTLMATAGPMARFVEDLVLTLPLMAGPDLLDASAVDARLENPDEVRVDKMRCAFHADNGIHPCTPETAQVVDRAAKVVAETGAAVEEARPQGLEQGYDIFAGLLGSDGGAGLDELVRMSGTTELSARFRETREFFAPLGVSAAGLHGLLVRRDIFRMQVVSFFQRYDVLLCPVCAFPALPHGQTRANLPGFSYTMVHNLSGCPAAVVRCGQSADGLPIAVQVVAAPWQEHKALAVALHLERVFGGWRRPPR